jgi:hypothetical protein
MTGLYVMPTATSPTLADALHGLSAAHLPGRFHHSCNFNNKIVSHTKTDQCYTLRTVDSAFMAGLADICVRYFPYLQKYHAFIKGLLLFADQTTSSSTGLLTSWWILQLGAVYVTYQGSSITTNTYTDFKQTTTTRTLDSTTTLIMHGVATYTLSDPTLAVYLGFATFTNWVVTIHTHHGLTKEKPRTPQSSMPSSYGDSSNVVSSRHAVPPVDS